MGFGSFRRLPLHNQTTQTYQELKRRILEGILHPSESLTETALSTELGVSRNTIKKALLMLESENLVVIEKGKRARVRSFSVSEMVQYLELREVIEGFVIRQSVRHLTDADLAEMKGILAEMERCYREHDLMEYSRNNWRFHEVIYRACPNRPAVEMTLAIKNQFKRYNVRTILIKGRDEDSFQEHCAIMAALEKREVDEAERLMRAHIANMSAVIQRNSSILF